MEKKKLILVGCGEIARVAYSYFAVDSAYEVACFAVDEKYLVAREMFGLPIVGMSTLRRQYPPSEFDAFVAIGNGELNRERARLYERVKAMGYCLASYVSSKAFVWRDVPIGDNCFILEGNVLQAFSSVGNNVFMWSGNHLGHSSHIHDNCFIASHVVISGMCTIGRNTFMGVNSAVAEKISVADDNFIAMSASISKSTMPDSIYRGNPAMRLKLSAKAFCQVSDQSAE